MDVTNILFSLDDSEIYCTTANSMSSSDEEDLQLCLNVINYANKNPRNTIKNYKAVIAEYSDIEFLQHFRMDKEKVANIIETFSQSEIYLNLLKNENTRANITAETHILGFLWFAGHQTASYRDVCDRFDLSLSSLHDLITRVSTFLSDKAKDVIKWPTHLEKQKIANHYYVSKSFPNVIGSIDGTHIKIDKPSERSVDYFNRKDFYSIVLQGICDHEKNFTDIFVGYAGSAHDARIFRNSTFFNNIERKCEGYFVLGDSAYPLSLQVLTPYRDNGHLTRAQKFFNQKLSSCRVSIEHAFGLLKQRFRQLYHLKLRGHERICHFIRACCVLHNLANKDDQHIFNMQIVEEQPEQPAEETHQQQGIDIRNEICRQMYLTHN